MNINLTLIGQSITFIVFVWFCLKFIWPHIIKAMDERKTKIAEGLAAGERGHHEQQLGEQRAVEVIREAKDQAKEILAQAHKRGDEIVDDAKGDGRAEGERMLKAVPHVGPQFGQHRRIQIRPVGDHDFGRQSPSFQVFQDRADHTERGRSAVKILKPRLRTDDNAIKRFLRESEYGARVEHASVVKTYDYGEEQDGLYYLALEWAEGEPLSAFVQRTGRLVPHLVSHILTQLAGALGAAHASGIIHRDLKPENIVYDPKTQLVKLLDFGIARDAQADPAQRLTRTGFFVGTLQYVAPEALSGELVGASADIFSLATITYYLLTDLHPFDGRSPRELFQQLLTAEPRPLNQAAKGLKFSIALEKAVMALPLAGAGDGLVEADGRRLVILVEEDRYGSGLLLPRHCHRSLVLA